jgi:uncharacterized protein YodC (DUF2158 family)
MSLKVLIEVHMGGGGEVTVVDGGAGSNRAKWWERFGDRRNNVQQSSATVNHGQLKRSS